MRRERDEARALAASALEGLGTIPAANAKPAKPSNPAASSSIPTTKPGRGASASEVEAAAAAAATALSPRKQGPAKGGAQ
jgi:hypothetical protein